ncbi:MAG: hypothetical protein HC929_05075 [Leptolyngbyaceae cyanobacterium SM2_5_2]|nr:hypothetical protein [Leptolyngbyaceae cyanobacterium SM2_5_2]
MIAAVIGFNCTLALLSIYLAWRLWRFGHALAALADALATWEHSAHSILNPATSPVVLLHKQQQVAHLRQQYAYLNYLVKQYQQGMAILGVMLSLSRWLGVAGYRPAQRFQKRKTRQVKHRACRERR